MASECGPVELCADSDQQAGSRCFRVGANFHVCFLETSDPDTNDNSLQHPSHLHFTLKVLSKNWY